MASAQPIIAILTDLPDESRIRKVLHRLEYDQRIETRETRDFQGSLGDLPQAILDGCTACILRPTGCPVLEPKDLLKATNPFYVCSLSVGDDHLQKIRDRAEILISEGGNAVGVAELAIQLANGLLRPIHLGIEAMRKGYYDYEYFVNATRIEGKQWLVVGAGHVAVALIPLVVAYGAQTIEVWNRTMDADRLRRSLSRLPKDSWSIDHEEEFSASVHGPSNRITRVKGRTGIAELERAVGEADIVSIHVAAKPPEKDDPGTVGLFSENLLNRMKLDAILVNVARGAIVNEDAICAKLKAGALRGYAADVLSEEAEHSGNVAHSTLWTALHNEREHIYVSPRKAMNIILTSHIGGRTDIDFDRTSVDAFNKLLAKLSLHAYRIA